LLIEELSEAALEAIEQAAGEAAKAATLSGIEREAAALHEAQNWRKQAEINVLEIAKAKKAGRKNAVIAVLIGIAGGIAIGVTISR
jgi:cob(I)alamin adenosyltransferase